MMSSSASLTVDETRLDDIARRLGIRMVLLYGSRATNRPVPRAESDLDIAVLLEPKRGRSGFWECYRELSDVFAEHSLDLAYLNDADPLFRWEVLRDGKLLWGDPLDHLEYRCFAYRDFVDSADLRALERRLFDKKMAHVRELIEA